MGSISSFTITGSSYFLLYVPRLTGPVVTSNDCLTDPGVNGTSDPSETKKTQG